jgi:hypothetical protein
MLNVLAPITPVYDGATSTEDLEGHLFPLPCNLSCPDAIICVHCLCLKVYVFPPQGYGWINPSNLKLISLMFRGQEQWAQCDSCSKWRRLPVDILLPPKWTCADNVWDQSR